MQATEIRCFRRLLNSRYKDHVTEVDALFIIRCSNDLLPTGR